MNGTTKKTLIAAAVAILILVAALVALLITEPKDENADTAETSATTSGTVTKLLYEKAVDTVSSVRIQNASDDFTIERTGDGTFGVDGYEDVELYTTYVDYLAQKSASVVAQKTITENADDLAKYGLKNPTAKVTVTFKNGETKILCFGDSVPLATEESVYFCFDGEKTVYSVLASVSSAYAAVTKPNLISTAVTKSQAVDADGNYPRVREMTIERSDLPYAIRMVYDDSKETYFLREPVDLGLSETIKQILPYGLYGISANAALRYPVTEKDMQTAGLDNPTAIIRMKSDAGDVSLVIGKKFTADDDTSTYLVMLEGGDTIYQVNSDNLPWVQLDISDVAVSYVYKAVANDISDITIKTGGTTEKFSKTGSFTDKDVVAKWNGKDMESDRFLSLYKYLFGFRYDSICTDETLIEGKTPDASITVKKYDGTSETVEYYAVENKQSVVTYNGKVSYLCRTSYVDRLQKNLELMKNGEDIVMTW